MPSHRRYLLTDANFPKLKGRYGDQLRCCICDDEGIENIFTTGDEVVSKKGRWYCIPHADEKQIIV